MTNFSMLLGSLMSILGMGSGLASQGVSIRQQLNQQQAYSQPATPGQGCWLERGGTLTAGTFAVVEHSDGTKTLECVPSAQESQR